MSKEQNSSPEPGAAESGAELSGALESGAAGPGAAGQDSVTAAPGKRRRPRRSSSAPTRLKQAAALLHTAPAAPSPQAEASSRYPAPGDSRPAATAATAAGAGRNTESGTGPASKGQGAGILPQAAAEDDPRAWGDSPEDTSAWLREQRPPHWG